MSSYKVKDFLIFHRYLARILLKIGLAEGSYDHILETVGEYTVTGICKCGEKTCNTVKMRSDSLIGKDGAFANPFNIAWIIINFYPDGGFEVESLADREECSFPFRQELRDVMGGKTPYYNAADAEIVVELFMEKLQLQKIKTIKV
ncbi:hypothetical protein ACFL0S_00565 [Thermodesulfobacteriota bacterium]